MVKLGLKTADPRMQHGTWVYNLGRNLFKRNATKELKDYEQEIKDRKASKRK